MVGGAVRYAASPVRVPESYFERSAKPQCNSPLALSARNRYSVFVAETNIPNVKALSELLGEPTVTQYPEGAIYEWKADGRLKTWFSELDHKRAAGPTLRDQFAMAAMTGLTASPLLKINSYAELPKAAYEIADAMLEARK